MWQEIKSSRQAIELLGGAEEVATLFKSVPARTVTMWGVRGFPAKTWLVLSPRLRRLGQFSPTKLFNMIEPRANS